MLTIQTFFNDNPVVAGIITFVIISVIVVAIYLIILLLKKQKKNKLNKNNNKINEESIRKNENEVINYNYFIMDFDSSGNLTIKKNNDKTINNPTKDELLSILNCKKSKLILPEGDKIEILIEQNDKEENKFITSKEIKDKNLFVFNSFVKYMTKSDLSWAISKFA